jgi:hypothetical protein
VGAASGAGARHGQPEAEEPDAEGEQWEPVVARGWQRPGEFERCGDFERHGEHGGRIDAVGRRDVEGKDPAVVGCR